MSNKNSGSQHVLENADSKSSMRESIARLVPLKTTLETTAREAVVDVYIAAVPPQRASAALR
jgi:hypothetical protein